MKILLCSHMLILYFYVTINQLKETPLHIACKLGRYAIVKYMLEKGADYKVKNYFGKTCKEIAERYHKETVVKLLDEWIYKNYYN